MKNAYDEMALQSYCLRGLKENKKVIDHLKKLGLSAIELCGVHVDFHNDQQSKEIIDLYHQENIKIVSIGVVTLTGNSEEENYFKFASQANAEHISVSFKPALDLAAFQFAEEMAKKYNLQLGIHNHGGSHWLGNSQLLEVIFANTGDRIGLCLDTAWALAAGEDPLQMAEKFQDRLTGVHFKDFVFDIAGKPEDVIIGEGAFDLGGFMKLMKKIDFQGINVLEYEGDVDNPLPSLEDCLEAIDREQGDN